MLRYNIQKKSLTSVKGELPIIGETIETKIDRIVNNNEPITDGAPLIYQDRKEGVNADFNIRTDRWDYALDAMDVVSKTKMALRAERQAARDGKGKGVENPPIPGTEPPKPAA